MIDIKSNISRIRKRLFQTIKEHKKVSIIIVTAIIICITITYFTCFGIKTVGYNKQVKIYNSVASEYNKLSSQVAVYNIYGFYDSVPELERAKTNPFSLIDSRFRGNTIKKVKNDTRTIKRLIEELNAQKPIIKQLQCPDESWVIERLKGIKNISGFQSVDSKNNPDGILGREGGYKACIYFSLSEIDQEKIPGNSIVDKGTDCGGSIEIYESRKNAEERCSYLSEFENTILYSGSYAIVGTMVIRTSYLLNGNEQLKLTDEITKKLTEIS